MVPQRPIGAHVLVAGGLAKSGLRYAAAVGAEAIQVFVSNPRGWALTPGDPAQDAAFARYELPVFVHASYLVNLGSPDPTTADRSVASLRHALHRGAQIAARVLAVHTGSAVRGDRVAAPRQVGAFLLPRPAGAGERDPDRCPR